MVDSYKVLRKNDKVRDTDSNVDLNLEKQIHYTLSGTRDGKPISDSAKLKGVRWERRARAKPLLVT